MSSAAASLRTVRAATNRYTSTAQALHWVVAALMFIAIALAWVMVNMAPTMPSREAVYTLHKSFGMTILALTAIRLAWRSAHPAPDLPPRMARWERWMAFASHWLLYLVLIGMPVSGYILSATTPGKYISYFGLFTFPNLPQVPAVADAARWAHYVVGQWLVYGLIVLHLAATAWHTAIRRDGVLDRMLPEQSGLRQAPPARTGARDLPGRRWARRGTGRGALARPVRSAAAVGRVGAVRQQHGNVEMLLRVQHREPHRHAGKKLRSSVAAPVPAR